jgi:hypothetical protein
MDSWQLIFSQSKVNDGAYDGDRLPDQHWVWPEQTWFQKRRSRLRKAAPSNRGNGWNKSQEGKEGRSLSFKGKADGAEDGEVKIEHRSAANFSVMPLLMVGDEISAEARRALVENRLSDAARLLMREYGLSCAEAGDLLNVSMC